jgi:hypothetical protein
MAKLYLKFEGMITTATGWGRQNEGRQSNCRFRGHRPQGDLFQLAQVYTWIFRNGLQLKCYSGPPRLLVFIVPTTTVSYRQGK